MQLLAKKHSDWVQVVSSFGCDRQLAEDITQEMYIKIQLKLEKGLDISYGKNDINYYYVFKTLRTLFLDLKRKTKNIKMVDIENLSNFETDIDYTEKYELVKKELKKMYWYDRKVFDIIDKGTSVASLARRTKIPYHSLYNTYRRVLEILKKKL